MHLVIFSHGFGVRKDDRGLFTDIAASLPDAETVMFDYNQYDETNNTLTATPLDEQAKKLRQKIAQARAKNPDATIDVICHSQGCVVAAMLQPQNIRKVIFLAPPDHFASVDKKIEKMHRRPGTKVNKDGSMSYPRRDGSTTLIPKVYWESRRAINPMALYNELAKQTALVIVRADQDEVIGATDFSQLEDKAKIIHMDTGHDFEHEDRNKIAALVAKELGNSSITKPLIIVTNDQDEIITHKERGTITARDIYRVSALWVTNSNGDVLLAQRKFTKTHHPGKWGPAVAGTVDEGETYESNIIKGAEEEIGLKNIQPALGPKRRISDEYNYFCQWYKLVIDKPAKDFTIQEEEVEQVRWFSKDELQEELHKHPEHFLTGFERTVENL